MEVMCRVVLKRNEEHRLKTGHPWIFSNEIASAEGPVENGDLVSVWSSRGVVLGYGFYCQNSLVAVRIVSSGPIDDLRIWMKKRIAEAFSRRGAYMRGNVFRGVYAESDFLPGLIIDRFGSTFVIESMTHWVDRYLEMIADVLTELFRPRCILEKSESSWRTVEGLVGRSALLAGEYSKETIELNGVKYELDLLGGQKTGFYLDQEANRQSIRKYACGSSMLDCFCNDGGFALNAACAGAKSVMGIDASIKAIANAERNSILNTVSDHCNWIVGDVFRELARLKERGDRFNLVILDPPSFVKSRKKIATALKGYQKLNEYAFDVMEEGGILVTCCCSHHVSQTLFLEMLQRASARRKKLLTIHEIRGANSDHPVLLSMPETRYLVCVICSMTSQ